MVGGSIYFENKKKKLDRWGKNRPHGIALRRDCMIPVEKIPRTLAHACLGPNWTWVGDHRYTQAGAAHRNLGRRRISSPSQRGANTRVRTLAGGHNQRPPHHWAIAQFALRIETCPFFIWCYEISCISLSLLQLVWCGYNLQCSISMFNGRKKCF